MGVFMVVRTGAALVGRISEVLVSYRWAPTAGSLSYLVQMTDAGHARGFGEQCEPVLLPSEIPTSVQACSSRATASRGARLDILAKGTMRMPEDD